MPPTQRRVDTTSVQPEALGLLMGGNKPVVTPAQARRFLDQATMEPFRNRPMEGVVGQTPLGAQFSQEDEARARKMRDLTVTLGSVVADLPAAGAAVARGAAKLGTKRAAGTTSPLMRRTEAVLSRDSVAREARRMENRSPITGLDPSGASRARAAEQAAQAAEIESRAAQGYQQGMAPARARQLETIEHEGRQYYIDDRLRQLRAVDNPHDIIEFDDYDAPLNRADLEASPELIHLQGTSSPTVDSVISQLGADVNISPAFREGLARGLATPTPAGLRRAQQLSTGQQGTEQELVDRVLAYGRALVSAANSGSLSRQEAILAWRAIEANLPPALITLRGAVDEGVVSPRFLQGIADSDPEAAAASALIRPFDSPNRARGPRSYKEFEANADAVIEEMTQRRSTSSAPRFVLSTEPSAHGPSYVIHDSHGNMIGRYYGERAEERARGDLAGLLGQGRRRD